MQHRDDDELLALMRELVECGKQNTKREEPRPSFKDNVGTTSQILGITVVILTLVGFLMSMRADVNSNTAAIAAIQKDRPDNLKKLNEMWWMKENGISNKEAFQQQHGYPAPQHP